MRRVEREMLPVERRRGVSFRRTRTTTTTTTTTTNRTNGTRRSTTRTTKTTTTRLPRRPRRRSHLGRASLGDGGRLRPGRADARCGQLPLQRRASRQLSHGRSTSRLCEHETKLQSGEAVHRGRSCSWHWMLHGGRASDSRATRCACRTQTGGSARRTCRDASRTTTRSCCCSASGSRSGERTATGCWRRSSKTKSARRASRL